MHLVCSWYTLSISYTLLLSTADVKEAHRKVYDSFRPNITAKNLKTLDMRTAKTRVYLEKAGVRSIHMYKYSCVTMSHCISTGYTKTADSSSRRRYRRLSDLGAHG